MNTFTLCVLKEINFIFLLVINLVKRLYIFDDSLQIFSKLDGIDTNYYQSYLFVFMQYKQIVCTRIEIFTWFY